MKIDIEQLNKSQKEVRISLTPRDMEPFLNSATRRLSKDLKIKGFREGHIPRNVLENKIGRQEVWQEAASEVMEKQYLDFLTENKIEAIGKPIVQILKIVPGNDFEFKITIPILPDVILPDYMSIAKKVLSKNESDIIVSDKELDETLRWLQQSRMSADKDSKAELPELNDDFAKSLGEFKNLQELQDKLKENILQDKQQKAKQSLRLKILEEIGKSVKLDMPESLIEQEIDVMQQELEQQLSGMDITLEKYLENAKQTLKGVREGWMDRAKGRVENSILLRLIVNKEGIEVKEKEVDDEADKYLRHFGDINDAQEKIDPDSLRAHISGIIKNEKVFELLEKKGDIDLSSNS